MFFAHKINKICFEYRFEAYLLPFLVFLCDCISDLLGTVYTLFERQFFTLMTVERSEEKVGKPPLSAAINS